MPPRNLGNRNPGIERLGDDPPLLQCRPSPAASHPGAYLHPPKRKLRVAYSVGHMCETFPPNQREACDIPRASIKVGAENRLRWSHLRREFLKIAERGDAPIATEAVARIAQIYVVEKDVRGARADERRAVRQARSRPLVDALKMFFEHQLTRLAGGSETAKIIRYGLRHWNGLTRFLDDGRIELDTNIVERSMRPQALTRKNALPPSDTISVSSSPG